MLERIKRIMEFYNLSSTQLADKIGAQRSAVSHVLSGRNRPSLDFVSKIKETFPDVNLEWLILGQGDMIKGDTGNNETVEYARQQELKFNEKDNLITGNQGSDNVVEYSLPAEKEPASVKNEPVVPYGASKDKGDEVEMIVHYFKNGTYKVYTPR